MGTIIRTTARRLPCLTKASLCDLIYKVFVHCTNYVNFKKLGKRRKKNESSGKTGNFSRSLVISH